MNTRSLNRETCFDKELFSFVNNDLNADTKPAEINNFIDLSHLFESICADTREEDNNLNLCMKPDSLILSTKYYVDKQNNGKFDRGLCGDEIENYHDVNANQMPYLHDMSTGDNAVSSKDLRLPFNDKTLKANKHSNNRLLFLEYLLESEARVTQNTKRGAALKRMRQLRKLQSKRNLKTNLTCRRLSLWGNKDDHFLHDALNIKQIKPMMKHTKTQQYIMKHDMKSSSRIDPNCTVLNDIELSNVSLQSPEILLTSSSLNTFDKLSDMSSSSLSPDSLETLNSVTESLKDFSPYGTLQPCQVFTTDANIKPNQHRDTYEDVEILSHETSSEKDGTYLTSAESALSLSSTSEVSSNNHCNPTDRTEITISQVAPSVCVNESNAVLCGAPQTNVQNYLIEIIGNSLISDSIYMTSIIKSLGIQHSLTSNQQKKSIESMCDTVSTSVILEKIEQTQSEQILDGSNLLSIKPKPIQILSTSTRLEQRTSPTQKVSGNYLLTKEELQEDIVLEKSNAKVSQWSNTLKRKGPFVCNPSNPAQYRYQPDVQLRKKLRPYKCITLRKICLNPRTKNYTARAHVVSTISGALPNNVLISRTNKREEKKKKDCKKENTLGYRIVRPGVVKKPYFCLPFGHTTLNQSSPPQLHQLRELTIPINPFTAPDHSMCSNLSTPHLGLGNEVTRICLFNFVRRPIEQLEMN
ncbi:hypothetical protein BgiBS90_021189 [Biomphalaria glabrata]|nr:hypothetical protein BgiBS90_021189 [Biomphalaria glabrata]